ncbi:MAG: hypothetical protein CL424_14710 [Acidimicrobiaceae bacterium]|nr:hypothetical protein [Acidimicrobiaceae bacterium]
MRRSTAIALGAIAIVLVVIGSQLFTDADGAASSEVVTAAEPAPDPIAEPDSPSPDEFGVLHGWARDPDGALAAAIAAVRSTGPIARAGFITRSDMIKSLASEAYGPTLATESANRLTEMTAEFGAATVSRSDLVWSEIPLSARVVAVDDLAAQVEVWSVLVVAVPDVGAPRQAWRTVRIDLVWERDDWRVDGWTAVAGPTPLLDATVGIASTDDIRGVLSWSPIPSLSG